MPARASKSPKCRAASGQPEQALGAFRQANSLAPGNASAWVALVRALYLGRGYGEAWVEVERTRSLSNLYRPTC